jgi:hypothetical protein
LDELGWLDAFEADPQVAVSVLFEHQGATNTTSSALDDVMGRSMGLGADRGDRALVLPALRRMDEPGTIEGGRAVVTGVVLGGTATGRPLLVVVTTDTGARALAVAPDVLTRHQVGGLDPRLALVTVHGHMDVDATRSLGAVRWKEAVALGQLALAHQLVGCARAMLELARGHALDRVQFGRPIASFQAVRHRLADSLVAVEAAAALADAAWEDPATYGAMAKAFAGRSARTVSGHCQQVLAGIGFTTEHPLHHFVRRTLVLDQLLGAGADLTRHLGEGILGSARLPRAFPL